MEINEDSIIKPIPTNEIIDNEERLWNIKLPNEYVLFIQNYNGCIPNKRTFFCQNKEYLLERFLCILEQTENHSFGSYDIDVVLTQIEDRLTDNEELVGVEVLPIAKLVTRDYLCLDYRENKQQPKIILWDNEESGDLEPVFYKVTKSFEEFIKVLLKK